MSFWLLIGALGLVTFLLRLSFIALFGRVEMPPRLKRALRFVPASVLSAIIAPALFYPDGALDLSLGNERLLAGGLAALVAWRTRHMLLTIAVGMGALWLLRAFLP